MSEIDKRVAQRILENLRTSGQPPKWGASEINVGTERLLDSLRTKYLEDHCAAFDGLDGGGACKWVVAEYGNGKTQFLRCLQAQSWKLNYVTAYVELSQEECPLDRPERVFAAVAGRLQASPTGPADIDRSLGFDQVLCQLFDRRFPGVLTGMAPSEDLIKNARQFAKELKLIPAESTALLNAASVHLLAKLDGDSERDEISKLYLRGEKIPPSELKKIGVYEKLEAASAFRLLRSVCQLLQRSGLAAGTVLLFDEARKTLSLMSMKSQKKSCENLLSVINHCNSGEFPGTLFLYAVMTDFFTNFADNYPALQQRCGPATRINLNELQGLNELDLLKQIAKKVAKLFSFAYDFPLPSPERLLPSLDNLAMKTMGENTMGTGTRRDLVKSCVAYLDRVREGGGEALDPTQAEELLSTVREELNAMERNTVNTDGE